MTHVVTDTLLHAVYQRLLDQGYGHLSDFKTTGDFTDDPDAYVDGPLRSIVAAVVDVLAEVNGPTWTDRLELRVDQAHAAQVQCCEAGRVAYPSACPWHGEDDPMHDPQYKRGGKA